jgi:hypothetical protein
MEEEDRGRIFSGVRYTIIPSDELDDEETRLVRKRMMYTQRPSLTRYSRAISSMKRMPPSHL